MAIGGGKLQSAGSKTYGYDAAGRQTSVTSGGQTTTVAYDYEGRITQITYPGGATNTFAYNGLDTRVGKVDSSGTKTYKRDGVDVTSSLLSDGAANYTPGVSERRSGVSKFTLGDWMGTTEALTNGSQSVTDTRCYDAFGMLLSSTGSTPTPFGYAGGYGYQEDGDSGLKLLGRRYYDASTGRFLTRDPAKYGQNWYSYCDNRPTSEVDPAGLASLEERPLPLPKPKLKPKEDGSFSYGSGTGLGPFDLFGNINYGNGCLGADGSVGIDGPWWGNFKGGFGGGHPPFWGFRGGYRDPHFNGGVELGPDGKPKYSFDGRDGNWGIGLDVGPGRRPRLRGGYRNGNGSVDIGYGENGPSLGGTYWW